jgi:hypothetical protein
MKNRSKQLIAFYTENGADHAGRIWEDIYGFSDEELESTHDYIQWLFPTITPSAFNSNAVLLDAGLVYQLSQSAVFNLRFNKSLERILDFWGIKYTSDFNFNKTGISICPITHERFWMRTDNHNLLRMSRVMESCRLLGFERIAKELFEALLQTTKTNPDFYFIEGINIYWWYKSAFGATI